MTSETFIPEPELIDVLRNELTVILGQCDMLEDVLVTEADSLARVKAIKAVALRMADRISHHTWPDVHVA
jgi:hypothetical protein